MNRLKELFKKKSAPLLSVFYTAGYPKLDDTLPLAKLLEGEGVDLLEIGFPFSDPVADGPAIQHSSEMALKNGLTLEVLFKQLKTLRPGVKLPVLLMGYINPVMQYGFERFLKSCSDVGIDGVIIPDLPVDEYVEKLSGEFKRYGLANVFLITDRTNEERIRYLDAQSDGFLYVVSTAAITGGTLAVSKEREEYFKRLAGMKLKSPLLVGFGIGDRPSFELAAKYTRGAIVGSAFIRALGEERGLGEAVRKFVKTIRT